MKIVDGELILENDVERLEHERNLAYLRSRQGTLDALYDEDDEEEEEE